VYRYPNHPLNGNRLTKPVVRWFRSWQVDGHHIPSVFYYSGGRGAGSFNRITGQKIKPVSDTNKRPKGKRKEAEEKCKDFRESPKMRTKCIFDYMMMGPAALKDSKKDRMEQRKGSMKKPTDRSVRDLSTFRSDGEWIGQVSWGCAGDFLKQQGASVKRFNEAKKNRESKPKGSADLHANKPTTVPQGQWIQSEKTFQRPVEIDAEVRAVGSRGTFYMSLFNDVGSKYGGLTFESGTNVTAGTVRVLQSKEVGKEFRQGDNTKWHAVRIAVNSDGIVKYYVNKQLIHTDKTSKVEGKLAFIGGTRPMQLKNVRVKVLASSSERKKRVCMAHAAKHPQDGGDLYKLPACPQYQCNPSSCECKCPGEQCAA